MSIKHRYLVIPKINSFRLKALITQSDTKKLMSKSSQDGDFYSRLMTMTQEAMENGYFEAAYHTLCASLHVAYDLQDKQRLEAVRKAVIAQLAWIDKNAPEHKMSTKSIAKRKGVNLYNSLLTQIDADLTILKHKWHQEDIKEKLEL
ncbi:hypothetical protein CAL7716_102860 (plasmid) [Calothrix sp. PCC 7716]|nr:hypothetical protein CAL7716_102860 [Calothrix sp. PCC 7716]